MKAPTDPEKLRALLGVVVEKAESLRQSGVLAVRITEDEVAFSLDPNTSALFGKEDDRELGPGDDRELGGPLDSPDLYAGGQVPSFAALAAARLASGD